MQQIPPEPLVPLLGLGRQRGARPLRLGRRGGVSGDRGHDFLRIHGGQIGLGRVHIGGHYRRPPDWRRRAARRTPARPARGPRSPRRRTGDALARRRQHDAVRALGLRGAARSASSTCPTVAHGRGSAYAARCRTAGCTNGRKTDRFGRSFHDRSSVERPHQHAAVPRPAARPRRARRRRSAPAPARSARARESCDSRRRGTDEKSPLRGARNGSNTGWPNSMPPMRAASPRVRSTGLPIDAGSRSTSCGQVARGPVATNRPPPCST